jgi:HAD superfamily hydrolase (TIGR01459 family)
MTVIISLREIAPRYDAILCDVWGVVHNGREHFAAACDALSRFRSGGGVVVLVTNAPRPNPPIREQLDGLRVPRSTFDDMVTSGDVTLARIADHGDAPLHHIGPSRDLTLFEILHAKTGLKPRLVSLDDAQYVVCTGLFDDRADVPEDYDAALAKMRARDLDLISANPDIVVHVGDTLIYCSGAIAERYEKLGGRVIQAGKPFAPIYDEALKLVAARAGKPIDPRRILAIGDGLRTDVKGACDYGLDCLFVTTGIHRDDLHVDDALDRDAMTRLLVEAGVRPVAAIPELVW